MILFSCNHGSDPAQPDPAYQDSLISWRQNRVRELTMSDGWLALAGRYWLKEGEQSFGAGRGNDIIFPGGTCPDTIGWINLTDDRIFIRIKNGTDVRYEGQPIDVISMITDRDDKQTYLTLGSLKWHIIKRGDRFALRLTDSNSKSLREFRGLEYFPVDPSWCIPAQYVPYDPPKTLLIATVIGTVDTLSAPGYLSFQVGRKAFRLDPVQEPGSGSLFIIFADETTAVETYGGGRFLDASLPDEDGNVILDFNKAYNPPCAFTEFATCPLPPDQNKLAISITAGEKSYSAH
ncbi:MAG: DUF1684 domain-containing protein [Bacteroidales bacterium]|nr:DUF1684 domain-containing protein [Lentimicrobiaceae bacterium]MDD5695680.1 DUF1684 domain-containing protein [Bacteroidales bacterium]